MGIPKRHHYVPEFYLRYFLPASDSSGFWVYDKEGGPPRLQTPQNTAVERYFYATELPDGSRDHAMERLLAQLEGIAKPILDRWQEPGARPVPAEVREIAIFLGYMYTRVPRTIEAVKEIDKTILLEQFKEWGSDPKRLEEMLERYQATTGVSDAPTVEEMRSFLERPEEHFEFEVNPKFALGQALMSAEAARNQLLRMNWCLCEAPTGESYITGDCPLCVFFLNEGYAAFGAGLGLPQVEVAFPISPTVCLLLDRRHTQLRRRVNRGVVTELNRRIAWIAERFVIASFKSNRVESLVRSSATTRTMPKVDRTALAAAYRAERHGERR